MAAQESPASPRLRRAVCNLLEGCPHEAGRLAATSPKHAAQLLKDRVHEAQLQNPKALERARRRWRRDEYQYDGDGNLVRADFATTVAQLYTLASPHWCETFTTELARGAPTVPILEYLLLSTLARQSEPAREGAQNSAPAA